MSSPAFGRVRSTWRHLYTGRKSPSKVSAYGLQPVASRFVSSLWVTMETSHASSGNQARFSFKASNSSEDAIFDDNLPLTLPGRARTHVQIPYSERTGKAS